jgi:hypothetical protein
MQSFCRRSGWGILTWPRVGEFQVAAGGREQSVFGDPLELIWKNCIFDLCGVHDFYRRTFGVVVTSTAAERKAWLVEVSRIIEKRYPKDE